MIDGQIVLLNLLKQYCGLSTPPIHLFLANHSYKSYRIINWQPNTQVFGVEHVAILCSKLHFIVCNTFCFILFYTFTSKCIGFHGSILNNYDDVLNFKSLWKNMKMLIYQIEVLVCTPLLQICLNDNSIDDTVCNEDEKRNLLTCTDINFVFFFKKEKEKVSSTIFRPQTWNSCIYDSFSILLNYIVDDILKL